MSPSDPTPLAQRLVKAAADAVSEEMRRDLSGEAPTGGHGYYAPGIVAALAVLREMADVADFDDRSWHPDMLRALADSIEKGEADGMA